ncbi:MAG: hypothetical protein GFH24_608434n5 [Chloroflexi bacterium AL-N5]|nr:hypothetical protein [Chloroflexi bacterium AL-N5]
MGDSYGYSSTQTSLASQLIAQLESEEARLCYLRDSIIAYSTNGYAEEQEYRALRDHFMKQDKLSALLPKLLRTYPSLAACYEYLHVRYLSYHDLQTYLHESFQPILRYLAAQPVLAEASPIVVPEQVPGEYSIWDKARDNSSHNPEGAITLAVINLENTCRAILNSRGSQADPSVLQLYGLYQETIKSLRLYQTHQADIPFKALLSGMTEIVSSLDLYNIQLSEGSLSRLSSAQALLAVNSAEAIASYLLQYHRQTSDSSLS